MGEIQPPSEYASSMMYKCSVDGDVQSSSVSEQIENMCKAQTNRKTGAEMQRLQASAGEKASYAFPVTQHFANQPFPWQEGMFLFTLTGSNLCPMWTLCVDTRAQSLIVGGTENWICL